LSNKRVLLVDGAPALPPQIAAGPEVANCCGDLATVRPATADKNSKLRMAGAVLSGASGAA
jgi:hypothetical protein